MAARRSSSSGPRDCGPGASETGPTSPPAGCMLDISRDRVPTRETLAWLVDVLDRLRLNHLELYTEHTFAYAGHEDVWRDASPMTAEDVRWLDAECAARGIELVANQNCFGHFERWLRLPEYRPRAVDPRAPTLARWRRPRTTPASPSTSSPS